MLSLYEMLWIVVFYSFLGWCVEVIYAAVDDGKFVNRGFLNGPVCPIYGFGVLFVVLCLTPLKGNIILLLLGSVLLTSALEFATGYVLERFFDEKWWDYSDMPFNIKGYVCLKFSLLWGVACVAVINSVHPLVMKMLDALPHIIGVPIVSVLLIIFAVDASITVAAMLKLKKHLNLASEIAFRIKSVSVKIGEPLSDGTLAIKGKIDENMDETEELREKFKAVSERVNNIQKRLLKSFPHLENGKYSETFERMKQHWTKK